MYYRIKFKAALEEFIFELTGREKQQHVTVRNIIRTVKENFKIKNVNLVVLNEDCSRVLRETEDIENARTYIIKRIPLERKIKMCNNDVNKCQKVLYRT